MRKWMLAAVTVALVGCTTVTVADLENKPPFFTGHSEKAPSELASCIKAKWSEIDPTVNFVDTGDELRVMIAAPSRITELARIRKAAGGSDVSLSVVYSLSDAVPNRFRDALKTCL
jgi:hypothetical protein